MGMFFVASSPYAIQQIGITAGVGSVFVIVYLMTLLAIIIGGALLCWGLWRLIKARQGQPRKPLSPGLRAFVIILSIYPSWMAVTYLKIWYGQHTKEQSRKAQTVRRYTELTNSTRFGEIEIPAGSLINRGDPERFTHLPYNDPLLDLEAVRFQQVTPIAGAFAYAMSVMGSSLTIELAKAYQLETPEGAKACPMGYTLMFPFPNQWVTDEQRIDPPYTWFRPSDWQPTACFDSTTGVMVMHVNKEGIYFPKAGMPYISSH